MRYFDKKFSVTVGSSKVTQEEWDRIFAKRRPEPRTVDRRKAEHVCGLTGYNPMIDERCPGCAARHGAK